MKPASAEPIAHLHSLIGLLTEHHRRFGTRLSAEENAHAFLITRSAEENLKRIARRVGTRARDGVNVELRTVADPPVDALDDGFPLPGLPSVNHIAGARRLSIES